MAGNAFVARILGRHGLFGTGRVPGRAARRALEDPKARRATFFAEAGSLTPYLAARIGDELFFVSTSDKGVGRAVFVDGWRNDMKGLERSVQWLAQNGLRPPSGSIFVDVGANIGTTTILALRRHGFASGVALEPSPENYRALRLNLVANELESRVEALRVAASDEEGDLLLDVSKPNMGGHRIVEAATRPRQTVEVEAVTLDGLVRNGVIRPERVGLLWVDAPRHEGRVLAGASALIEASVPLVVAIRQQEGDPNRPRPWYMPADTRASVIASLTAHYTDVVELRRKPNKDHRQHPIADLPFVVDSFRRSQDLLLVRR